MPSVLDLVKDGRFEAFPRRILSLKIKRSRLFRALAGELVGLRGLVAGKDAFQLTGLGDAPDDVVEALVPLVRPEVVILVGDDEVSARIGRDGEPVLLFPKLPKALYAFNRFNGATSIGEIAQGLAVEFSIEPDDAFSYVRGLFLSLVETQVCIPSNPPTALETQGECVTQ